MMCSKFGTDMDLLYSEDFYRTSQGYINRIALGSLE